MQFGLWTPSYDAPAERLEMHEDNAAPVANAIADMVAAGDLVEVMAGRQWERG